MFDIGSTFQWIMNARIAYKGMSGIFIAKKSTDYKMKNEKIFFQEFNKTISFFKKNFNLCFALIKHRFAVEIHSVWISMHWLVSYDWHKFPNVMHILHQVNVFMNCQNKASHFTNSIDIGWTWTIQLNLGKRKENIKKWVNPICQ